MSKLDSVLVVQPTEGLQESVHLCAEQSGIEIAVVANIKEAYEYLSTHAVSTVVINFDANSAEDENMIDQIRRHRRVHEAHIIAVSHQTDSETLRRAMRSGANDYYSLPVYPKELHARLLWIRDASNRILGTIRKQIGKT